jgi:hypothetical protein
MDYQRYFKGIWYLYCTSHSCTSTITLISIAFWKKNLYNNIPEILINSVFVSTHTSKYKWWQRTNVITYKNIKIVRNTLQKSYVIMLITVNNWEFKFLWLGQFVMDYQRYFKGIWYLYCTSHSCTSTITLISIKLSIEKLTKSWKLNLCNKNKIEIKVIVLVQEWLVQYKYQIPLKYLW